MNEVVILSNSTSGNPNNQEDVIANLLNEIKNLKERVEKLESEEFHSVQPYTTYSKFLKSDNTEIVAFDIPRGVIPDRAKSIEFHFFVRTGSEGPSRNFTFHVWTVKNGQNFKKTIRAFRYPQSAISFDDQKIWLPFDNRSRFLYCQMNGSEDVQKE